MFDPNGDAATSIQAGRDAVPPARQQLVPSAGSILKGLSWLDRLLPLWIFLAMVLGVLLSVFVESVHTAFDGAKWNGVSAPLAVGLIVMIVPPFCAIEWERLPGMLRQRSMWMRVLLSCMLNWLIGPLLMLGLAWATLPDLEPYRIGITLVGLARCIGMVLVWNSIAKGDNELCALLVILNSAVQLALYAPMATLFVGVISGSSANGFGYATVARSVGIYLGIPIAVGTAVRIAGILALGAERYRLGVLPYISPWALIGLVYTIVVIFAQQGDRVIHNLGPVFRTCVPLLLYFVIMWTSTFFLSRAATAYEGVSTAVDPRKAAAPPGNAVAGDRAIGASAGHQPPTEGEDDCEDEPLDPKCCVRCDSDDSCDFSDVARTLDSSGPTCVAPGDRVASYATTVTQAFTAASNNFELSIAVATAVYGASSEEALAATVGALLEVPVLLALSYAALWLRGRLRWRDTDVCLARCIPRNRPVARLV